MPLRKMSYPVTPVLSLEPVQVRLTWVDEIAVADRPVGTLGDDVSTVQVAEAVVAPLPVTWTAWPPGASPE